MAFPNDNLVQDAVYWAPAAEDKFGKPGFAAPVAVKCRWEDVAEEFVSADGTDAISKAHVFVTRDMLIGGALWLGLLAAADDDPEDNSGFQLIKRFDKVPTLHADAFFRKAYL